MKPLFHDLTRTISQKMPVYTGDPQPVFEPHLTIEKDQVNVTKVTLGSHTGTHVDAQWHFLPDGNSIDGEALDKFIGDAVIVDVSGKAEQRITAKDLDGANIMSDDIVLFYTDTGDSCTQFSYLDISVAEWMVKHRVKCVGIDTLSVEKYGSKDAPVHKMLLSNNIGIIENLTNLRQFVNKRMFLVCLPLPLQGVDGSPARAVLFEIIK